MPSTRIDPKLDHAMKDSLKAYAAGNARFFDYLRDDVRVFNLNSVEPMVGRRKFQEAFQETFRTKRKVQVISSDIQPSGDQAVLSQTLQVTVDGITSTVRQTVIWNSDGGNWQMSHIHNALVGQPVVSGRPAANARAVRVLNERIAVVAATVGVAQ